MQLGSQSSPAYNIPTFSVPQQASHLHGGDCGGGVRVGVEWEDLIADELLDKRQGAPRGHVVAVGDGADPERAAEGGVGADHTRADVVRELCS